MTEPKKTDPTPEAPKKRYNSTREKPERAEALVEIRQHIDNGTPGGWKKMIAKYLKLGIKEATFWRWVHRAREFDPSVGQIAVANTKLAQYMDRLREESMPENAVEISRQLPSAPSPNYVAHVGAETAFKKLDMIAELHGIYSDAHKLREFATRLVENKETGEITEQIKNPIIFERQMMGRLKVIDVAIKTMGEVWNLRTIQEFYQVIIQEIGKADVSTQKRIMVRLATLNAKTGMSMNVSF